MNQLKDKFKKSHQMFHFNKNQKSARNRKNKMKVEIQVFPQNQKVLK